jgi:hypothetical protein
MTSVSGIIHISKNKNVCKFRGLLLSNNLIFRAEHNTQHPMFLIICTISLPPLSWMTENSTG